MADASSSIRVSGPGVDLENLFKYFLLPSGLIFTVLTLGIVFSLVRKTKGIGRWLLLSGAVLYALFASGPISFLLLGNLEHRYPPILTLEASGSPKPIVVLAGHTETCPNLPTSSTVNGSTAFRIIETVWLLQKSTESKVIISGHADGPSVMKQLLSEIGVDGSRIQIDNQSASTYESALSLKDELLENDFYLVTSAGHMLRSMAVFKKQGMNPVPAPTDYMFCENYSTTTYLPSPLYLHYSDLAVHEYLGMLTSCEAGYKKHHCIDMLRTLPSTGHPLRISDILGLYQTDGDRENSFLECLEETPYFLVSSGSAALTLALSSLKVDSVKTEVALPAYTCPSLLSAVVRAGLRPVLCDLKPNDLRLDLNSLASKIGPKTLAVMVVHLYGTPENVIAVKAIAERSGAFLIEDAAQAFGNRIGAGNSKQNGRFGDLGILSFGRGKPLSLLSGGVVIVNNPALYERIGRLYQRLGAPDPISFAARYRLTVLLYSVFFHPRLHWLPKSLPWLRIGETFFTMDFDVAKMGPGVTSLGNTVYSHFSRIREKRISLAKRYTEKLTKHRRLFTYLPRFDGEYTALLRFPVVFREKDARDRILKHLQRRGLGVSCSYPVPLNELKGTQLYVDPKESFPNAKRLSERIMTLPLHEYVRSRDVDRICRSIGVLDR